METYSLVGMYLAFAGFIWMALTRTDAILTKESKQVLSRWIRQTDLRDVGSRWALPFSMLFDRIFGTRHLAWKCFLRSSIASLFTVFVLALLWLFNLPQETTLIVWHESLGGGVRVPDWAAYVLVLSSERYPGPYAFPIATLLIYPLVMNLVPDYLALLETRWTISLLERSRSVWSSGYLLILNVILNLTLSFLFLIFMKNIAVWLVFKDASEILTVSSLISNFRNGLLLFSDSAFPFDTMNGIFIYSTFMTSAWSWIFVISGTILNWLGAIDHAKKRIELWFDIDDKPLTALAWSIIVVSGVISGLVVVGKWVIDRATP